MYRRAEPSAMLAGEQFRQFPEVVAPNEKRTGGAERADKPTRAAGNRAGGIEEAEGSLFQPDLGRQRDGIEVVRYFDFGIGQRSE
jgi:hypothetical protein